MEGAIKVNAPQGDHHQGSPQPGRRLTPEEARSRRARNIAIGLGVGFLVILFYVVTVAKLGVGVVVRPSI
ncbi:MAG: hypothetical protein ACK4MV_02050 [Beijerinckiaceae bacterium]